MGKSNDAEADAFSGGDRKQDREFDGGMNRIDADRLTHLQFLQNMERVDRAIRQADDLEQMLKDTLDVVLDIFDADRALLLYPCDPAAESFSVPMERTRAEYPGACEMGFEPDAVSSLQSLSRDLLDMKAPMSVGSGSEKTVPPEQAKQFAVRSVLCMPIFPKVGSPWIVGMHQCSRERKWTEDERQLFQEIGRRIADSLSSFLAFRELQESESRYRALVENIPGAVYQCDLHNGWEICFFSGQIGRITGYPPSHFIGQSMQSYFDLVHPDDLDMVKRSPNEKIQGEKTIALEYRIKDAAGAQRWVFSRGQAVYDKRGKACRLDGVINDITERKVAEEALQASEEKYRSLFQWSADPMFLLDGDVTMDCNKATVEMYGYRDRDSMLNKHPWDFSPEFQPDGTPSSEKALEIISELPEKRSLRFEWIHKRANGEIFPAEIVLTYIKVGEKQLVHAVARDITELKRAEDALRESEEKYRALFEGSADATLLVYGDTFVDCNDAAVRILRCGSKDDILQRHPWDFAPEFQPNGRSSLEIIEEAVARMPQERSLRFEWYHRRADGVLFPADVLLTYIAVGDKPLIHAVWRDITDLKMAEKEARHLRNLLNNIINSMPSVLIGVDVDANVIQWNLMAQKASGISPEEAQGKNLLEVFPKYAGHLSQVRQSIADREAISDLKIPVNIEGETRFSDITIYPLITNGIDGAVIRIDDVTERVQVEEMIVQSEKMLSVGGLAAGMAHEINNPLAGILQSVQVILDRFSPDMPSNQKAADEYGISLKALNGYLQSRNITDLLRGVHDSGRRAARIVDNMLSFSRKSSAEFARKNLAEIIDRTLELTASDYVAKRDFQFHEIQIERDYAADLPDVPCEETEIQQVILNLLKNAAHAMVDRDEPHPPPCLTIRTSRDADMAKIEIQDNGPGMSEAVRRRVFEPFYTTKSVGVGTGLGLSVSYFIITEKHQGTLSVESTPGKGTKFIIRLPMERKIIRGARGH